MAASGNARTGRPRSLCGDTDGLARDLAEARRLFAEMGVTGWDDYARSIEGGPSKSAVLVGNGAASEQSPSLSTKR